MTSLPIGPVVFIRYTFRLLAVDEPVSLTGLPSYRDVETAVTGRILGEARLIGTYQR